MRSGKLPLQSDGNLGAGRGGKNVPGLGLAVRHADRLREGVVRVNLDGQRFIREQQLEQQCGGWSGQIGTLKPQLTYRDAAALKLAPGPEIGTSPGFVHDLHAGMFDRHAYSPGSRASLPG